MRYLTCFKRTKEPSASFTVSAEDDGVFLNDIAVYEGEPDRYVSALSVLLESFLFEPEFDVFDQIFTPRYYKFFNLMCWKLELNLPSEKMILAGHWQEIEKAVPCRLAYLSVERPELCGIFRIGKDADGVKYLLDAEGRLSEIDSDLTMPPLIGDGEVLNYLLAMFS